MISREYRQFTRAAREKLVSAYRWSRDHGNTPEETVEILIDEIGRENAQEIVAACIITVGDWDARISNVNRRWAAEACEHTAEELNQISGFYCPDEIHRTHMDQIADVIRKA